MRKYLLSAVAASAVVAGSIGHADEAAANKWINEEFQPSVLTKDEQLAEMKWFIDAAAPFSGMEINVLSEGIPTHGYESEVLTKAFEEITGIKVNHQILGEGEVVQAVQTQMQTQRNLYDAYVNDSDLIGTHSRLQLAYNLTDFMAGEGADVRFTIGFEQGKRGKNLHYQMMLELHMKEVDFDSMEALKNLFKAVLPVSDGLKFIFKTADEVGQTEGGCFGYVLKDKGRTHFFYDSKGFTEEELESFRIESQGFRTSYTVSDEFPMPIYFDPACFMPVMYMCWAVTYFDSIDGEEWLLQYELIETCDEVPPCVRPQVVDASVCLDIVSSTVATWEVSGTFLYSGIPV